MFKTAKEAHNALIKKEISAKELLDKYYKKIDEVENDIQALISTTKEIAYACAEKVDAKIKNGEEIPYLAGIPLVIKDNICVKDTKTTAASKMLENFVSPYNATIVNKLNNNLIPIIAKANMDEFAMGSSTENSAFKLTKNPVNLNKVPGGSSGGSAAAVAGEECLISLGSDTGGSIRLPASFCGVVGLKPTYGRVSRYGLIAFASSLDQIGPFANCVEDTAALLEVIAGYDTNDSTCINTSVPNYTKNLSKDIKGLKIGVVKEFMSEGLQSEVQNSIQNAIEKYKSLGAEIVEVSFGEFVWGS